MAPLSTNTAVALIIQAQTRSPGNQSQGCMCISSGQGTLRPSCKLGGTRYDCTTHFLVYRSIIVSCTVHSMNLYLCHLASVKGTCIIRLATKMSNAPPPAHPFGALCPCKPGRRHFLVNVSSSAYNHTLLIALQDSKTY